MNYNEFGLKMDSFIYEIKLPKDKLELLDTYVEDLDLEDICPKGFEKLKNEEGRKYKYFYSPWSSGLSVYPLEGHIELMLDEYDNKYLEDFIVALELIVKEPVKPVLVKRRYRMYITRETYNTLFRERIKGDYMKSKVPEVDESYFYYYDGANVLFDIKPENATIKVLKRIEDVVRSESISGKLVPHNR